MPVVDTHPYRTIQRGAYLHDGTNLFRVDRVMRRYGRLKDGDTVTLENCRTLKLFQLSAIEVRKGFTFLAYRPQRDDDATTT